ncbi:MAG: sorbosone dehydrogenase [Betaproteobacteria bacterium RIFCSPLOWO2_02_FULL_66_14]|nr:MAG: sorbosone dehydrogenase [Betaproteobacteria bacterium RIFCSPLOWO2_02_FULL_66_14]
MHALRCVPLLAAAVTCFTAASACAQAPPLDRIELPPGFRIELLAQVPNARSLALGARGTLFVGSRSGDKVHAVSLEALPGGGWKAQRVRVVAQGLNRPNGVAFRDGALYVAEVSRVLRLDRIEDALDAPPAPVVVYDRLPSEVHHGWKFIRFGPDGQLYVPIGAPCNVCEREGYALIGRMPADGSRFEVFAQGVRNTVGFDWHPATRELWFTDNGRDWLGDDLPADELNHAPRAGQHFGFPYCHQGDLPDPQYGRNCDAYVAPAQKLGAHVAALGMRFYTGAMFPPEYRNQILIAEHGSWNRSRKVGYRLTLAKLEGSRVVAYQPFAKGWLQGESAWGRPVDLEMLPDGSIAVSDDLAGAIYRISYRGGG